MKTKKWLSGYVAMWSASTNHLITYSLIHLFLITYPLIHLSTFLYSATISSQHIGCVDMNRIMEEYPDAKKIKDELSANVNIRKESIKNFRLQIDATELEIENMDDQLQKYDEAQKKLQEKAQEPIVDSMTIPDVKLSTDTVEVSTQIISSTETVIVVDTGTVTNVSSTTFTTAIASPTFTTADIEAKKKSLENQKDDLEKYISDTKQEEKAINNKAKKNIMGKIYDTIEEVSSEEGLTVVVDSCNLIYGEDAQDITDKVLKKLK
ncbi:MAG: OmpH family outer membrane protein [Elusimicrobiota bacterium]